MKIVLSWLQDYVCLNAGADVAAMEEALIQLGHEVDGVTVSGADFPNVVVGTIVERVQHPNADRLGVCQVDVGAGHGGVRQIVCGAPNARAGLTVAVALPGAELPAKEGAEPFKIGKGVIRGIESDGMICSQRELGLGEEHNGIWEMETDAAAGTPLNEVLGPGETVLDVAVTPNRGDCLSHVGIARELAAAGLGTFVPVAVAEEGKAAAAMTVATRTADCPLMLGCVVSGVTNGASPEWVQKRLAAAGLRPRNAVVDATNYVMLALGQPMHAYDAAKVQGGLVADTARAGEAFAGLNEVEVVLKGGEIVIRDEGGAVLGLAGILGGRGSAVGEATTTVMLEAAYFDRVRTALTGQAHQIHTDARARFERGVDPAMAEVALRMCAALIAEWTGGRVSVLVRAGDGVAAAEPVAYDPVLCATFGGLEVAAERQGEILAALGFTVVTGAPWQVTPPSWRTYMQNPEDIVEEILRVEGYDKVPSVLPPVMPAQAIDAKPVLLDRTARRTLAANGVREVMTYSFIGRDEAERFGTGVGLIEVANPLAETSMTTMRPSLLPGLLRALAVNLARSEPTARLGEVGKVYGKRGKDPAVERLMAAVVLAGGEARHWRGTPVPPDVFAAKGLAMALLGQLGAPVASATVTAGGGQGYEGVYHPGRSGSIQVGPFVLARFGELHPAVLRALDLPVPVAVLELELEPLLKLQVKPRPFSVSAYPPVKRDLAFLLPLDVPAAAVQGTLAAVDRELIKDVSVFDVYGGEGVPAGMKSLALALTLQSAERTLVEADIVAVLDKAVAAVKAAHGGGLRA